MNSPAHRPKPPHPARAAFRRLTLVGGLIGLLLSLLWPLAEWLLGSTTLNHLPGWLGGLPLFILLCYAYWEIRLSWPSASPRNPPSESASGSV